MTEAEGTAPTTTARRQWALRKKSSERQHFKVIDGRFVAYSVEAPPPLGVVMAAEHRAEAAANAVALAPGQQTAEGVYAGLTSDGKQQIFTMPKDLDVTMTFNDAAKAVEKLNAENALGHHDWQIPALENIHVLRKNQNEGALKGTFKTAASSGSDCPGWYWSSTVLRDYPSDVHVVRLSDGYENWFHKDNFRLSCRPVRLVTASSPSLG